MPRHGILPLRVRLPLQNTGDGLSLQPSVENGARSSKGQTDGGSGRRSRLKRTPQRIGRGGEHLREIASRERHRRVMAITRRCHRLLQKIVAEAMPVTHALPLVTRHGSRHARRQPTNRRRAAPCPMAVNFGSLALVLLNPRLNHAKTVALACPRR